MTPKESMRHVAAGLLSLLALLAIGIESKTVEYTYTLQSHRASPAVHNVTKKADLNNPSLSPDCNLDRLMLLVNDVFPGPTIYADVGDVVKVTVINESPYPFALHYHGLDMLNQPYLDGTASITQCAAGPMQTQLYEFEVTNKGTHYWHGHVSLERADGFQGAIIINDPNDDEETQLQAIYDAEEVIFLADWYHRDGNARRTGLDTVPFIWIGNAQSTLINGGGIYTPCLENKGLSCAADCSVLKNYIKTTTVEDGKTYRLRIIGAQELIGLNFAIQGHTMTVVEVEGTIVEPYVVSSLDIMPAQRYSVLVTFNQGGGNYWATTGVRYREVGPTGYIMFKYSGAPDANMTLNAGDKPAHPVWNDQAPTLALEGNLFTKSPSSYTDADVLSADAASIRRIILVGNQLTDKSTGKLRWAMNNITYMAGPSPLITVAYDGVTANGAAKWPGTVLPGSIRVPDLPPTPYNYTAPIQDSVGTFNGATGPSYIPLVEGEFVEVVLQNTLPINKKPDMHSWHLHGHSFWVVGWGYGNFNKNTDPASYNLVNPVRRDTVTLLPYGWTVIRFKAYNPGAWFFHCAQPAHAVMGMGVVLITSPDKMSLPPPGAYSCLESSLSPKTARTCFTAAPTKAPTKAKPTKGSKKK